jgi:hypothetical protein
MREQSWQAPPPVPHAVSTVPAHRPDESQQPVLQDWAVQTLPPESTPPPEEAPVADSSPLSTVIDPASWCSSRKPPLPELPPEEEDDEDPEGIHASSPIGAGPASPPPPESPNGSNVLEIA